MDGPDDHERWAELAAGHVLSALSPDDEVGYLRHAAGCAPCQALEYQLRETVADLALLPERVNPPPSLKDSIMRAAQRDDAPTAPVVNIGSGKPRRRIGAWLAAAAAAIVVAAGGITWAVVGSSSPSVTARCDKAHCPTVALVAEGRQVATVLVLDRVAYVRADGLPATPAGHSYVLWRISKGQPVGVAAIRTRPDASPVDAGTLKVALSDVDAFALSEEPGAAVPPAPTRVLAQGAVHR